MRCAVAGNYFFSRKYRAWLVVVRVTTRWLMLINLVRLVTVVQAPFGKDVLDSNTYAGLALKGQDKVAVFPVTLQASDGALVASEIKVIWVPQAEEEMGISWIVQIKFSSVGSNIVVL